MAISEVVRRAWNILTVKEKKKAFFLLILMIIGMMMETLSIGLIVPVVSLLVEGPQEGVFDGFLDVWGGDFNSSEVVVYGMVILIVVFLIKTIFIGYQVWMQSKFIFDVQASLSERLLDIYLKQPYSFHLENNSAQLIRNVVTEVAQYGINAISPLLSLLAELLVLAGLSVLLFLIEPVGAVTVMVLLGVAGILFYRIIRARAYDWGKKRQVHEGKRIQHLQQSFGANKDVKLLGCEDEFLRRYSIHGRMSAKMGHYQHALQLLPRLWLELLGVVGLSALVVSMAMQGKDSAAIVPVIALFATSSFRLIPSVNRVLGAVQSLRYATPVVNLLNSELCREPAEQGVGHIEKITAPSSDMKVFSSELTVTNVSFSYESDGDKTLNDISMLINKGETIGIIGPSGSGKSTLVDVLIGLLEPNKGEVCADGVNIYKKLRAWQSVIGYVPQSIYLTDDTLRNNIAFGLSPSEVDDNKIRKSLNAAQLSDFVDGLTSGYDEMMGEFGVKLSGGQRQRIGIARALYHDPEILVFDEATSALDMETESDLMESINFLKRKKTIIIIAHRLETVRECDRIYCLERGKINRVCGPGDLVGGLKELIKKDD